MEKLNRREFLATNFQSIFKFMGEMILPSFEQERNFIRPPGSDDEIHFLTTCTRCGICKDVCPVSTIDLFNIESGAKLAGTPFINVNEVACTFCDKCIDHCPTNALSYTDTYPKVGTAKVVEANCMAYKNVMCDYCVRSCPVDGALTLYKGKPEVHEGLCTGCGECSVSCIESQKGIFVQSLKY